MVPTRTAWGSLSPHPSGVRPARLIGDPVSVRSRPAQGPTRIRYEKQGHPIDHSSRHPKAAGRPSRPRHRVGLVDHLVESLGQGSFSTHYLVGQWSPSAKGAARHVHLVGQGSKLDLDHLGQGNKLGLDQLGPGSCSASKARPRPARPWEQLGQGSCSASKARPRPARPREQARPRPAQPREPLGQRGSTSTSTAKEMLDQQGSRELLGQHGSGDPLGQ